MHGATRAAVYFTAQGRGWVAPLDISQGGLATKIRLLLEHQHQRGGAAHGLPRLQRPEVRRGSPACSHVLHPCGFCAIDEECGRCVFLSDADQQYPSLSSRSGK